MTRQHAITLAFSFLATGTLSGAVSPSTTPEVSSRPEEAAGAPTESNVTLMWSTTHVGTATYPYAVAAAAAFEEGGYTDWRLPTVDELQAAVTDSDPNTFGQTTANSGGAFWSSKKQGTMWAFCVEVNTDANGYPIPSLSGRVIKATQTSFVFVKCVRP